MRGAFNVTKGDSVQVRDLDGAEYTAGPVTETIIGVHRVAVMQGKHIGLFDGQGSMICAYPAVAKPKPRKVRVGFDIGGVLSKYPDVLRPMVEALLDGGAEVFVVTDMKDWEKTVDLLWDNGFKIPRDNVHCADFERYGEACKAKLLQQLELDMFMDDFPAYLVQGCPVRLQVLPDLQRPYYHDTWKTDGAEGDFGRRPRVQRFIEEDL